MTASYSSTSNTDLRIIKTRRAIRLAFEELLKQTDYSQITVSAIARKALINRNTFYAHYDSVDALLNELYRENIEKAWNEAMGKTSAGTGTGALNASSDLKLLTRLLLTALDNNFEIESNLIRSIGVTKLIDMLINPFFGFVTTELERRGAVMDNRVRCLVACYVGGITTAYVDWHRRSPRETIDELADQLSAVFDDSVNSIFNA